MLTTFGTDVLSGPDPDNAKRKRIEFIGGPMCGATQADPGCDVIEIPSFASGECRYHKYNRCENAKNFFWHSDIRIA